MDPMFFLGVSVAATVFFVGLDAVSPTFRRRLWRDALLRKRNVGYVFGNLVSIGGLAGAQRLLSGIIEPQVGWDGVGVVVEVVACVVVAELINWVSHWVKHVQPWLWTFHVQHHVGRHYDTTLVLHTHPIDVVISGVAMSAVLMVMGFSKFAVDVFVLLYFVTNLYKHAHMPFSLGPLDRIIVGPSFHRVHHTLDGSGNFGSVLTLFDVLFGTAVWPPKDIAARAVGVVDRVEAPFVDEMLLPFGRRPDRR
jgi:sterol desaturase/sphingolipid hydroxylase (fatty acid hydroxylase superfamily)